MPPVWRKRPLLFDSGAFVDGLGAVFAVMATLFAISAVGFLGTRSGHVDNATVSGLTRVLVDVIVPAQLAHAMIAGLDAETISECGTVIVAMGVMSVMCLMIAWLVTRVWRGGSALQDRAVWSLSTMQNGIYVPLPLVLALTPAEQHARATILISGAVIMMIGVTWTLGVFLLRAERAGRVAVRDSIKGALNPPMISIFVGAALAFVPPFAAAGRGEQAPMVVEILVNAAEILGSALPPLAMLVLGLMIGQSRVRSSLSMRTVGIVTGVRLIAAPVVMIWALTAGPLSWVPGIVALVLIVQAAAPPATNLSIVARRYGGDWELVASVLLVTYIIALVTLPLFTALVMARPGMP